MQAKSKLSAIFLTYLKLFMLLNFIQTMDFFKRLRFDSFWTICRIKTGFLGFFIGISSLHNLFDDLVRDGHMRYILTYKLSQDHLELLFGVIRTSLGSNNNPTVGQFEAAMKRILVHQDLSRYCTITSTKNTMNLMHLIF
jgi:hypothetical protein